ncbi:MAG: hypothetical protein U1E23_03580 [Reyranellaceae bacterium]
MALHLRRWHRLGLILTLIGGIAVFWGVFTRDDELGELVHYRQTTECRVAERRGLPADKCYREVEARREALQRQRAGEAALVTAGAIAAGWIAAFLSVAAYRWVMAGSGGPAPTLPSQAPSAPPASPPPAPAAPPPDETARPTPIDRRTRRRERVEPRLESRPER